MPVNRAFAEAVARRARARSATRPSSSTTTTSTSLRGSSATRGRTRGSCTSSTSRGPGPTTGRCCRVEIRRAIHDGLLANDVVGFHTRRWRRNFIRAAEDVVGAVPDWAHDSVGYDGRRIAVTASPISVDPAEFDELAHERRPCSSAGRELVADTGRRSSCCASTGPIRRRTSCAASARSSSISTRIRRCTGASACSRCSTRRVRRSPSTPSMSLRSSARRAASTIASSRTAGCRSTLQISDNFPRAVAAYKEFDVLFVNAIFDGLNLVAKEAPLVNERDGVLILSENAGAHEELGDWALSVNPFDVAGAGRRDPPGARDAGRGAARPDRSDPCLGARARPRRVDRAAAAGARCRVGGGADERALARLRVGRGPDGGRRRQAALPPPRGRVGTGANGGGDGARGCASCRRATRSSPRSSRGSWPRSEPRSSSRCAIRLPLTSIDVHGRRRRRVGRDHGDRRDDRADRASRWRR